MTISVALMLGIASEKAARFSLCWQSVIFGATIMTY